ncbi:MAG: ABC transporter permease [Marinicella sp.]|nr:ABC transporter permease [Xanthomonadales bacterium]
MKDISDSIRKKRLWAELAKLELKVRFRGTYFGVIWVLLALVLKVGMISLVYSLVLHKPLKEYVLFLSIGVLTWNYISALVISSTLSFLKAVNYFNQMSMSHFIFVFQTVYRETLILLLYQLLAIPIILVYFGLSGVKSIWLWSLLGYLLIILNGVFAGAWLGWVATRYRDVQHLISNLVMILFIVTPVLWPPPSGYENHLYFQLNPFYHLLEIVRAPIINGVVPVLSFQVSIGLVFFNFLICVIFYKKAKDRLVLWF